MRILMLFLSLCFFVEFAFSQSTTSTTLINDSVPTAQEVSGFIENLGGWKALGSMGFAMIAAQALLLAFRSSFIVLSNGTKLLIVSALTLVIGILTLVIGGMPWGQAVLTSLNLPAFQVFFHQIIKQVKEDSKAPDMTL